MRPFEIFVGYDPRERIAFHACVESILDNASVPVSITPLYQPTLKEFVMPTHLDGYKPSNGFIFTRFLTPYLSNYRGKALFLDGDMIVQGDVGELMELDLGGIGVRVVKHDYQPKYATKYLNNVNKAYPRKNWSSVILWNCGFYPNSYLTPEAVGSATGEYLHQFKWLSESQIGELPKEWNYLVGEDNQAQDPKLIHFTNGIPAWDEWRELGHGQVWDKYVAQMNSYQRGA